MLEAGIIIFIGQTEEMSSSSRVTGEEDDCFA